jgi:type II secretory ATPase GspE/PulE/Tfp pilus assembly ATPase PilB-like protein
MPLSGATNAATSGSRAAPVFMNSLIQNGIELVKQGITTPEEILRVVLVEDIIGLKKE